MFVGFEAWWRVAERLMMEKRRASQRGGVVDGDSRKAAYYTCRGPASYGAAFVMGAELTSSWNLAGCIIPDKRKCQRRTRADWGYFLTYPGS